MVDIRFVGRLLEIDIHNTRTQLDRLFAIDSLASSVFGILSLLAPHGLLAQLSGGGSYNHATHETLR